MSCSDCRSMKKKIKKCKKCKHLKRCKIQSQLESGDPKALRQAYRAVDPECEEILKFLK
jgi:hypothetical protein